MLLEQDGPGTPIGCWCYVHNFMHSFGPSSPRFVGVIVSGQAGNVNLRECSVLGQFATGHLALAWHLVLVMLVLLHTLLSWANSGCGIMSNGDTVRVSLTSGKSAKRVVWDTLDSSVFLCTPTAYDAALKSGRRPRTVEYREWAVKPV